MYLPVEQWDYLKLMRLGKEQPGDVAAWERVAVLGNCTTQYYTGVLRGIAKAAGMPIQTWEAEYNTVDQTLLDEGSGFYSFQPTLAIFVTAVQALRDVLLAAPLSERAALAEREAERLVSQIRRAACLPGVTVVVHNLVVPYERAWGNLTSRVEGALPEVVRHINGRLSQAAAELDNVFLVDCDHIASVLGKRTWFDERLWFYSKSFCHPDALPQVAGQAVDILRAVKGKGIKCVALDLDNTLWGGVIGDDGMEGIRLGELGDGEAFGHFQRWLKELSGRGILLAVCSKNDEGRAREVFQQHRDMELREGDLACFIANWDNKADNLRRLAKRLNIGLDAILFLDDSPFERNLVRQMVPEVCVPEMPEDAAEFVPYLESLNLFETLQFSEEDRQRTSLYMANARREEEQARFTDLSAYLESLEMAAEFKRFDDEHLPRIAQLVQRTNQFNLTTIRHTAAELKALAEDPDFYPYYLTLEDRFGDNGLVSVIIGKRAGDALEIVTWLMSCRVFSRRLEEFALDRFAETARRAGLKTLRGRYLPTKKNEVVADLYRKLGFAAVNEMWEKDVEGHPPFDPPIQWKGKP